MLKRLFRSGHLQHIVGTNFMESLVLLIVCIILVLNLK